MRAKSFMGKSIFGLRLQCLLLARTAIVVAFHRVNNIDARDNGLTCSVKMFERYCRFFSSNFHVVPLGNIVDKLEKGTEPDRDLAITFDDGYGDNFEYAAPILKALGLPATFFVVTGFMGTELVPWWDKTEPAPHRWMNWHEVRWLHREGFEIGSHTRSHADLGKVSADRAHQEIFNSRLELEDQLSAKVELFAYPYGGKNDLTEANRQIVKTAGFRCCCCCYGGINFTETDPFHLRRIPISPWFQSPHQFGFELALRRV